MEAAALTLYLVLARSGWFRADEWEYLAGRSAADVNDLFRPFNEHWSTLPILAFRLLFWAVGLRSYVPYLVLIVLLHLAVAALLRVVMRRAGVAPWTATAAASLFAMFGTGYANIEYAVQIGYVGSLAFGLAHLLLADHDGAFDRRDWLGLVAGLLGLMCSGIGVTMVAVVCLAAFIRRGWRIAMVHGGTLGALFVVWFLSFGRGHYARPAGIGEIVRFVAKDLRATFAGLGQLPGVGLALFVTLVLGLVLAFVRLGRSEACRVGAAPVALLLGALIFLAITGTGRAGGHFVLFGQSQSRTASRYLHVVAALLIPALGVASHSVARRWPALGPALLAMLVIGVPGNIGAFHRGVHETHRPLTAYRQFILSVPRLPVAPRLPRSERPEPIFAHPVTVGWLLDTAASGRLPPPERIAPTVVSGLTLSLVLRQTIARQAAGGCERIRGPVLRRIERGQVIVVPPGSIATIVYVPDRGVPSPPVSFGRPRADSTIEALAGPLAFRISPGARGALLCRVPAK